MNQAALWENVYQLVRTLTKRGIQLVKQHTIPLLFSIVAVVVVVQFISWYRNLMTRELVLLIGPRGGANDVAAKAIAQVVEREESVLHHNYRVRLEATEGYEENRLRVSQDKDGVLFAFAHDGFGEPGRVSILLPLDRNYLHILCSRRILTDEERGSLLKPAGAQAVASAVAATDVSAATAKKTPDPQQSALFVRFVDRVKPGRTYLGPLDSGTRQVASLVLQHYGLNPRDFPTSGIQNWHDMRASLLHGPLDIAFYSGPLNAPIIQDVIRDRSCVLLTLGDDAEKIPQIQGHLQQRSFPPGVYGNNDFCLAPWSTLLTRNVLICSDGMPPRDAFFLAKHTRAALLGRVPEVEWKNTPPTTKGQELAYPVHPGAQLFRDGKEPTEWPQGLQYVFWGFLVWILAEVAKFVDLALRAERPAQPDRTGRNAMPAGDVSHAAQAGADQRCKQTTSEVEALLKELERRSQPLTNDEFTMREQRVNQLRQEALALCSEQGIEEKSLQVLLAALRALRYELQQQRPSRARSKPRRTASAGERVDRPQEAP